MEDRKNMEDRKKIPSNLIGCGSEDEKTEKKNQRQYADYC